MHLALKEFSLVNANPQVDKTPGTIIIIIMISCFGRFHLQMSHVPGIQSDGAYDGGLVTRWVLAGSSVDARTLTAEEHSPRHRHPLHHTLPSLYKIYTAVKILLSSLLSASPLSMEYSIKDQAAILVFQFFLWYVCYCVLTNSIAVGTYLVLLRLRLDLQHEFPHGLADVDCVYCWAAHGCVDFHCRNSCRPVTITRNAQAYVVGAPVRNYSYSRANHAQHNTVMKE